jgi:hypothetical protein
MNPETRAVLAALVIVIIMSAASAVFFHAQEKWQRTTQSKRDKGHQADGN